MRVVCTVVYLGLVVLQILSARVIADLDHALGFLTQQQEVAHVHCTRVLTFDGVVDHPAGGGIVTMDGGRGLRGVSNPNSEYLRTKFDTRHTKIQKPKNTNKLP